MTILFIYVRIISIDFSFFNGGLFMDKYELLLKMKKKFIERGVLTLTDYDYQVCQFIYDNLYHLIEHVFLLFPDF